MMRAFLYDAPTDMAEQYRNMVRHAMIDAFTEMFGPEIFQ